MKDETCFCLRCGETFTDALAWCAHKPLGALTRVSTCRFPRTLYKSGDGLWTVRPNSRLDVQRAEEASPAGYEARNSRAKDSAKLTLATARLPEA